MTELGIGVAGEAATSVPCDGACNVISGSLSYGIDLQGNGGEEVPASGSTAIRGNYIGMTASGGEVVGNATAGIVLGAAKKVTIGGPSLGEENHLNGGVYGILAGPGAESLKIGSTFQCKLDRKPFKKCSSPKTYKKVKPGKHVFRVRAIDKAGNVDPTPAKRKFTVLR